MLKNVIGEFDFPKSERILNRLLALEEFSLANYLLYAPPWRAPGEEPLVELVRRIAAEQQAAAERIGDLLVSRYGFIEPSQFPAQFAAYNDLSLDYLLLRLIEHERLMIDEITRCAEQLAGDPEAQQLAEQILTNEKRHLGLLNRLALPSLRGEQSQSVVRPAA
jgi:hypothetical protein